jgi:hypothetical protein
MFWRTACYDFALDQVDFLTVTADTLLWLPVFQHNNMSVEQQLGLVFFAVWNYSL